MFSVAFVCIQDRSTIGQLHAYMLSLVGVKLKWLQGVSVIFSCFKSTSVLIVLDVSSRREAETNVRYSQL
jgi:hypothetical protein